MPHKVTTAQLVDEMTTTAKIAGACNAILRRPDGTLLGDMFDGAGFVRGVRAQGTRASPAPARSWSAAAGSAPPSPPRWPRLASAAIGLYDRGRRLGRGAGRPAAAALSRAKVTTGSNDPAGYDLVVNATPLGMKAGDPLPFDIARIAPTTFVGEVVMKEEYTPLLRAARDKGCTVQVGTDMLFEMIPAYLEFFGFGTSTPEELRRVATIEY